MPAALRLRALGGGLGHRIVREHAAWALGALATHGVQLETGRSALETAAVADPSDAVRVEARAVLAQLSA